MFFELKALQKFQKYWSKAGGFENAGNHISASLKKAESWLTNAIVIDLVLKRDGQWLTGLVFVNPDYNSEFVVRYIRSYSTQKSAEKAVNFMRKLAAKDPQGTLSLEEDHYLLFDN